MNENVKVTCSCELGYDKGVLKKTIENNIFTIYGNITKNNYIILRYHGELIDNIDYENYENNLYISYFFDNNKEQTKISPLAKCNKCVGENYCALISLENYNNITFEFYQEKENHEHISDNTEISSFKLDIKNDLLTDILQKYGIEENTKLPVTTKANELPIIKIINSIKDLFLSLFSTKDIV